MGICDDYVDLDRAARLLSVFTDEYSNCEVCYQLSVLRKKNVGGEGDPSLSEKFNYGYSFLCVRASRLPLCSYAFLDTACRFSVLTRKKLPLWHIVYHFFINSCYLNESRTEVSRTCVTYFGKIMLTMAATASEGWSPLAVCEVLDYYKQLSRGFCNGSCVALERPPAKIDSTGRGRNRGEKVLMDFLGQESVTDDVTRVHDVVPRMLNENLIPSLFESLCPGTGEPLFSTVVWNPRASPECILCNLLCDGKHHETISKLEEAARREMRHVGKHHTAVEIAVRDLCVPDEQLSATLSRVSVEDYHRHIFKDPLCALNKKRTGAKGSHSLPRHEDAIVDFARECFYGTACIECLLSILIHKLLNIVRGDQTPKTRKFHERYVQFVYPILKNHDLLE